MTFSADSVPDLAKKTFVITGGNSGIGLEAARVLAARGARVVLACRDPAKMKAAAEGVRGGSAAEVLEVVLDLGSLASIRAAAASIAEQCERLDGLINNAGVMAIPSRETKDGFEMQLGTNHLGHFALTGLLLPRLLATPGARVVTVSSIMHLRGHIVFEDIPRPRRYDSTKAYAMSKLANLLFAYELDRRLQAAKADARSVACHPGYSATNLQHVGPRMEGSKLKSLVMDVGNALFAQSAAMGALPTLYAATSPDVSGGDYVGPTGLFGIRGYPAKVSSNDRSHDREVARQLWDVSERLTGVTYSFDPPPVAAEQRAGA